jgi:hypothetical protein
MVTNIPKIDTKKVYIECSKCKTQTPIGKFCIECGEKNTVEFLDYRIKSQEDANPTMIRICSHCNIDSNHIESKIRPFDSWSRNFINSKCTNCEKMNPKTPKRKNRLTLEALAKHYKPSKRFTPLQISRMSLKEQEPYFKTKKTKK